MVPLILLTIYLLSGHIECKDQHQQHNNNKFIIGNEDSVTIRDGKQREFWVSYNGCLAAETSVPNEDYKIVLWQVTNGRRLYQGVFDSDGNIRDCDVSAHIADVEEFITQYHHDSHRGDKGENVTISYQPIDKHNVDEKVSRIIDFKMLTRQCKQFHEKMKTHIQKKQKSEHNRQKRFTVIYPGTKWCGSGNNAAHDNDLGTDIDTDKCCREHDRCPYYITGFETKWNLFNSWFGTISHCDCDNRFKNCLRGAKSGTSDMVGKLFFNLIKRSCFVLRKRKVCTKKSFWGNCLKKKKAFVGKLKKTKKYRRI